MVARREQGGAAPVGGDGTVIPEAEAIRPDLLAPAAILLESDFAAENICDLASGRIPLCTDQPHAMCLQLPQPGGRGWRESTSNQWSRERVTITDPHHRREAGSVEAVGTDGEEGRLAVAGVRVEAGYDHPSDRWHPPRTPAGCGFLLAHLAGGGTAIGQRRRRAVAPIADGVITDAAPSADQFRLQLGELGVRQDAAVAQLRELRQLVRDASRIGAL